MYKKNATEIEKLRLTTLDTQLSYTSQISYKKNHLKQLISASEKFEKNSSIGITLACESLHVTSVYS